jgi:uncharacterized integral membrane protein (TIGR00698 family)
MLCGFPAVSASSALALGFLFSILWGNPIEEYSGKLGGYLLKTSVIGLGFGINIQVLLNAGKDNIGITTIFVLGVLGMGLLLGRTFKIEKITAILISVGTAICGGSAIAAVGSILKANANQLSIATGTVFLLNAVALFIFPAMGNYFELSQEQFGAWCAIAIHDTSSVVGAASKFGDEALQIASVTKMLRILWIIPVSLILVFGFKENRESFKIPMFIVGFLIVSCIHSFVNGFDSVYEILYKIAKQGLVMSLFIIGSNISIDSIKKVGGKIFLQAILLWILVSVISLVFIKCF